MHKPIIIEMNRFCIPTQLIGHYRLVQYYLLCFLFSLEAYQGVVFTYQLGHSDIKVSTIWIRYIIIYLAVHYLKHKINDDHLNFQAYQDVITYYNNLLIKLGNSHINVLTIWV